MDFSNEIIELADKRYGGCVIMEAESSKIAYVDGLVKERYGSDLVGSFGEDIFGWYEERPELTLESGIVAWESIDSALKKYYRIESSLFVKEEKTYQIHKLNDITEYMELNRDITKYISFFKKLSKFQAAVLEKLSNSYYELLPMLADYYVTNKVLFMIQHEGNIDITTYSKIGKQFSNDRIDLNPGTGKVFTNPQQQDLSMSEFDEGISNIFRMTGSNDDSVFRCLCQGDVSGQKYALYLGIWPNTDLKSMQESVVTNVIKLYLENGIMRENLIYESEHDGMTGLFNKGKYLSMVSEVYPNLDSIAYFNFDVNNLKKINDTMGHEAGDKLLIKAADSMRKVTNNQVHAYRMGGDEYLMVACNVTEAEANKLMERWEAELARLNTIDDGINCVVAVGMVYEQKPYDLSAISKKSDELMYEDKKRKKKPGEEIR